MTLEFFLRRITWLSARQFGLLAGVARVRGEYPQGGPVREDLALLEAFTEETAQNLPSLRRIRPDRGERLLSAIARDLAS